MLRTLLRHIGKYRTAALLTPMYTALECMVGVLIPYVTAWIIDDGIMVGNLHAVVQYGALMTVLAFASLAFGIGSGFCSAKASTGFARNLRSAMFRNIQTFSFANIDKFSTSGLITRLTTDVSNLQHAMQMVLRISVRAPLNLLFSIVMCVLISPSMSLIFVVATLLLGGGLYLIMSRAVRLFQQVFERYDDLNRIVRENISAIRVVKAFVREHHEAEKFDRAAVGMYALFTQTERLMALNHPMMNMVIYGCIIALSWFGAQQVVGGSLTTGQLTSLFSYVMMILNSLMMLSMIFVQLSMSAAGGKRVAEVLDETSDITAPDNALTRVCDGAVGFSHVSFGYHLPHVRKVSTPTPAGLFGQYQQQRKYAIRDVDLQIDSGQTIGVIGGTGSGKSTFAALIARLYDPNEGTVSVGGEDVCRYDPVELRKDVAIVLQGDTLFSGSILDNLRWGDPTATPEACKEACRIAQIDNFISQLPEGYQTHVNQGGSNLSGGQRQRLCIARALIKRPKILILDDATSACDAQTDRKIHHAMRDALPGTTKIIIAQRIQTVSHADRIIVMQSGRVIGFDTHEQLLADNRLYRDIYEAQTQTNADFDESV